MIHRGRDGKIGRSGNGNVISVGAVVGLIAGIVLGSATEAIKSMTPNQQKIFFAVCVVWAAIAIALLVSCAASAHDWYEGVELWRPDMERPLKCCGERDCAPYPHRVSPGETAYEVELNGTWVPVPMDKVVGFESPDGQVHVCCQFGQCERQSSIRCVILPGRGA